MLNGTDVGPESPHNVSTWVGSPKGYTGSQTGGSLTNGLRRCPGSVILIDEIEKAGPEAIQNVLLPFLGDGVVVDRNMGDTLSAYQCVVFCTSNIRIPDTLSDVSLVHQVLALRLRGDTIGRFNSIPRCCAAAGSAHDARWAGRPSGRGDVARVSGRSLKGDAVRRRPVRFDRRRASLWHGQLEQPLVSLPRLWSGPDWALRPLGGRKRRL